MSDKKLEEGAVGIADAETPPLMIGEDSADELELKAEQIRRSQVSDEDDETWTNQPPSSKGGMEDADLNEEDEDEEEEEPLRNQRKPIETARDVVCEELPERAQRAALRLKPLLTGSFVFDFTNSGERILFDWRDDLPVTKALNKGVAITCDEAKGFVMSDKEINVDAVISISESNLMAIRAGTLNPQVGMLTDKIRIQGKVALAVYIFNVIAPRVRH